MLSHQPHHQLILFGPPGTSKSYRARDVNAAALGAIGDDIVPGMFHPDYSYGEFVARLLPVSEGGYIHYNVHAGPFIRALALAYLALTLEPIHNVVLLIDEINRGNCAEIFGDVFQLLDREESGWSSYEVSASELVIKALRDEMLKINGNEDGTWKFPLPGEVEALIKKRRLKLPPNLYLIGTMNTSDESVYFMDSAFKRRWHFEFRSVGFQDVPDDQRNAVLAGTSRTWSLFINALNSFILDRCTASKMDDKLVGPWFIKARRKITPIPTLNEAYNAEIVDIETKAAGVSEANKGANFSQEFEVAVLALGAKLPVEIAQLIHQLAGYDPTATRQFTNIDSEESRSGFRYYRKHPKLPHVANSRLGTLKFIERLKALSTDVPRYEIDRAAVAGKLMLYLWDNVFDRDKSPLAGLLGVEPRLLRTFGQFTDQVDNFIEKICERAAADTAVATVGDNTVAPAGVIAANEAAAQHAGT